MIAARLFRADANIDIDPCCGQTRMPSPGYLRVGVL